MKKIIYLSGSLSVLLLFISLSAFQLFDGASLQQRNTADKRPFAPHILIENNTSNSIIYFSMAYYDASGTLITMHTGIAVSSGSSVSDNFPTNAQTVTANISVQVQTLEMYGVNCYSSYPNATIASGTFDISNLATQPILSASSGGCH